MKKQYLVVVLLCALVALLLFLNYQQRLGNDATFTYMLEREQHLLDKFAKQQQDYVLAQQRLMQQQAELTQWQQSHHQLKSEQANLKEELQLYRKIMAPEESNQGVVIEHLSITPSASPQFFHMQALLIQVSARKHPLKGQVDLILIGSENGQPQEHKLENVTQDFEFRYFQELFALFELPSGFVPEFAKLQVRHKPRLRFAPLSAQVAWPSGLQREDTPSLQVLKN